MTSEEIEERAAEVTKAIMALHDDLIEEGETCWLIGLQVLLLEAEPNGKELRVDIKLGAAD